MLVCTFVSLCVHIHICVCMFLCVYIYTRACMSVHTFVCIFVYLCVHIHMCVYFCVSVFVCVPMCTDRGQRRSCASSSDILCLVLLRTFFPEPGAPSFLAMVETRKPQEPSGLCLPQNWGYRRVPDVQLISWVLESKFQSRMLCSKYSWALSHLLSPNFKF